MTDAPEPQLQPIDPCNGQNRPETGGERLATIPKLAMVAAVIVACGGGLLWSKNTSPAPPSLAPNMPIKADPTSTRETKSVSVQLALLAPEQTASALAQTGFDPDQKSQILAAIKNRRMRLVRMPIAQVEGVPGQAVAITSGGLSQVITLTPKLQSVVVPILMAGEVSINPVAPPPAGGLLTGILTTLGPEILPVLQKFNQQIVLDVVVQ